METLETVQHPYKVIVMDCGLDAFQIITTMNKDQYTNFGSLHLSEKYLGRFKILSKQTLCYKWSLLSKN